MIRAFSVAVDGRHHDELSRHLTRSDGQEDLCFACWRPSTGAIRFSALVGAAVLPLDGERQIRGTASLSGEYALRAAQQAASLGAGIALLHSHPGAATWQFAPDGSADAETERKLANLAREITGVPLVAMTLATGSQAWSARIWDRGRGRAVERTEAETVRILGKTLRVSFHPELRAPPAAQLSQVRTVSAWGDELQAHLARLRVLVVGGGSVGEIVLEFLARSGIQAVGCMEFDAVEEVNLDRLHGARASDVGRSKLEVARRLLRDSATAGVFQASLLEKSVCEPEGMRAALDYDVIFSCVDRPWPRHVLNTIAYADMIPVIDGGVRIEGMGQHGFRNAYWRSQIAGPGRPCLRCVGQYAASDVQLERDGSLDDPSYIANLQADSHLRARQNVYGTSLAAASALINQFLSLVLAPSGIGDPGPLRFDLRQHSVKHTSEDCSDACHYKRSTGVGDSRVDPTGTHELARAAVEARRTTAITGSGSLKTLLARHLAKLVRRLEPSLLAE